MRELDDRLLARYLGGEASSGERAKVELWAESTPANRAELAQLQTMWADRPSAGTWDVDRAWANVRRRMDERPAEPRRRRQIWLPVAVAAAVLLTVAGVLARSDSRRSYTTDVGVQQAIDLPDGSSVVLAPASRLTVSTDYGRPLREVTLEGRAWFDVEHDSDRPFQVRTRSALIQDLGTEFEVLAPRAGGPVQVAVLSGAVSVRSVDALPHRAVTIGPRDIIRMPPVGEPAIRHEAPVEELGRWREGSLRFDDAPVDEVVEELGRWYRLEFRLTEAHLGLRRFNGAFPTQDLDEVLEILQTGLRLTVRRDGDAVILAPGSP